MSFIQNAFGLAVEWNWQERNFKLVKQIRCIYIKLRSKWRMTKILIKSYYHITSESLHDFIQQSPNFSTSLKKRTCFPSSPKRKGDCMSAWIWALLWDFVMQEAGNLCSLPTRILVYSYAAHLLNKRVQLNWIRMISQNVMWLIPSPTNSVLALFTVFKSLSGLLR